MLLCPVRDCRQPLRREAKSCVCARGHSFDIARTGYVNLLQPQDRRSRAPGDSSAAVAARRRLHDRGITQPLLKRICDTLQPSPKDILLDAGCGEGFYLGHLVAESSAEGHGVDISVAAIDAAARRYPDCHWVVANADRSLPYSDSSCTALISINGRMNPSEFWRVLQPEGRLVLALAAADDLQELRGQGRSRVERTISEFSQHFALREQAQAKTQAVLTPAELSDLALAIYRPGERPGPHPEHVTLSLDLLLFAHVQTPLG